MVTPAGFEPTLSAWEADLLNLLEDEAIQLQMVIANPTFTELHFLTSGRYLFKVAILKRCRGYRSLLGDPTGIRTRIGGLKGRSPYLFRGWDQI